MKTTYFTKEARTVRKEAAEARSAEIEESNNKLLKIVGGTIASVVAGAVALTALVTRSRKN